MTPDKGPLYKKSNAPKMKLQGSVWKPTLFKIFIVFTCQKFSRIPLIIEKYNNAIVL